MSWSQYLFGFSGRINRARYWAYVLVGILFLLVGLGIALPYILIEHRSANSGNEPLSPLGVATIAAEAVLIVAYFVAILAITAKRLHDRNKSGWWVVLFLIFPQIANAIADPKMGLPSIPVAGRLLLLLSGFIFAIWGFIELGCLRGTPGENRYGPDPLAR